MAITLNGTTGITTPDITSEAGLTVDGVSFASGAPANTLVTTSGGNVGVGTSSPDAKLDVTSFGTASTYTVTAVIQDGNYPASGNPTLEFNGFIGGNGYRSGVGSIGGQSLAFYTPSTYGVAPTERARIDASGALLVGTTATVNSSKMFMGFSGGRGFGINDASGGAGTQVVWFQSAGTQVGSITTTTSTTSYNTSSDYRLKENVVGVTSASERVQQLNPVRFNFIADPDTTVDGFLAHEVQDVVPEAITGAKDAVDAEGNPVYQGIDQSKLVPLLTAALQEALTKIETLEARVAALEAA